MKPADQFDALRVTVNAPAEAPAEGFDAVKVIAVSVLPK